LNEQENLIKQKYMDGIAETYNLETIEQLRAIADELRLRIMNQLTSQAMTVTQLAEVLGEAANKVHYHVRELERVGLLKLVETREKGGILEKYYRAVAKDISAPGTLFRSMPPEEAIAMLNEVVQPFFQGVIRTAEQMSRTQPRESPDRVVHLTLNHGWMTADELRDVSEQIDAVLQPYKERRGIEHEREQRMLWVGYTTPATSGQEDAGEAPKPLEETGLAVPESSKPRKQELYFMAGSTRYTNEFFEEAIANGAARNIYFLGNCTFADDVSPELVDRAIAGFHIWGRLQASPEVREVLKRKGGDAGKKVTQL
jgi:DNA-binding transcriptional ArsR family regulator